MISKQNIPNILTISRIVLIVPFIIALLLPLNQYGKGSYLLAFIIFVIATITDFFDGYLARKWQVESRLGAMLDPIADKLLLTTGLLFLISQGLVPLIAATVILLREVLVSGLREYLGKYNVEMPVSKLAKIKTTTQLVAVGVYLFHLTLNKYFLMDYGNVMLSFASNSIIWLACILTFATGFAYTVVSIGIINAHTHNNDGFKLDPKNYSKNEFIGLFIALVLFLPMAFS